MGHSLVLDHSGIRDQDTDKLPPQGADSGKWEYNDNSCMMGEPFISPDKSNFILDFIFACSRAELNLASPLHDTGCCTGGDGAQQVRTGL